MEYIEKFFLNQSAKEKVKRNEPSKGAVFAIASIPLVMTLGNSMFIPVLPILEDKLNISSFQVSMIITVYSIFAIFLIPIAGYISDHIGRKKIIIPSLIIAGIGGFISGWASWKMENPYWVILISRALQGIGAAGAFPIVLPLVGDMFKDEEKVSSTLGIIETSNTLGKVLSPILGAFLASIIWFLPFFSIPILCLISILLMALFVRRSKVETRPKPFKQFLSKVKQLLRENGRWIYTIFFIGVIIMFILFGLLFYLSEILERTYEIVHLKKGLYLAIPLAALCITSLITGKLMKENKVLMKWITFFGLVLMSIPIIALPFSKELWYMITMFLLSSIGIGASLPCLDSLITDGVEKEQRGTITSIYSAMRFIGVASGPPIIAILMKKWDVGFFYIIFGLGIIAAILSFIAIRPKKQ